MFFAALAAVVGLAACSKPAEKQETIYSIDEVYTDRKSVV